MCGILGIISNSVSVIKKPQWTPFIEALDSMKSRGPDDWGWISVAQDLKDTSEQYRIRTSKSIKYPEETNYTQMLLGHRRLAVIDVSSAGHQPMGSQDQKIWISYNGEIYNYLELREELCGLG